MGIQEQDHRLPVHCYTIAGATAGVFARLFGQPLDVLKIRFQLQNIESFLYGQNIRAEEEGYKHGRLKYTGVVSAARLILKEEGLTGLWKGHLPAQTLSIIYGAVQFPAYEYVKSFLKKNTKDEQHLALIDFVSGAAGGACATVASFPMDVIRTRLVAQSTSKIYNGMCHASLSMAKEGGIKTFYKGFLPSVVAILPYGGFHFCFYGVFKRLWDVSVLQENSKMKYLTCGSMSGMCSKLLLLPLDNMKKRLQVQGFEGHSYVKGGMVEILKQIFQQRGFRGLYQGAAPSIIKAAVTTGVTFCTYEQTLQLMQEYMKR